MTTQQSHLLKSNAPQFYLSELLGLYGPSPQLFRIDPNKSPLLVAAKGTRLTFPPFSLTTQSGKLVRGTVEIRLKEVFTQGEMIMAGRPTTSEDRLLESGGQLLVQAGQGQEPLKLAQPLLVDLPLCKKFRSPMSMRLFVGSTSTFQAYSHGHHFDWRMASDKAVRIRKEEGRKYYNFQLPGLNWAGCENFVARRSARCMVTARPSSPVEQFESQLAFLVFKDVHAVARMYPGKHNCTAVNIPEKLSATAHIIGLSRGRLYYGSGFLQRASDKLVNVAMRPILERELIGTLQGI